jgi:hypothetical protein
MGFENDILMGLVVENSSCNAASQSLEMVAAASRLGKGKRRGFPLFG